jgi:hypothetical protein
MGTGAARPAAFAQLAPPAMGAAPCLCRALQGTMRPLGLPPARLALQAPSLGRARVAVRCAARGRSVLALPLPASPALRGSSTQTQGSPPAGSALLGRASQTQARPPAWLALQAPTPQCLARPPAPAVPLAWLRPTLARLPAPFVVRAPLQQGVRQCAPPAPLARAATLRQATALRCPQ